MKANVAYPKLTPIVVFETPRLPEGLFKNRPAFSAKKYRTGPWTVSLYSWGLPTFLPTLIRHGPECIHDIRVFVNASVSCSGVYTSKILWGLTVSEKRQRESDPRAKVHIRSMFCRTMTWSLGGWSCPRASWCSSWREWRTVEWSRQPWWRWQLILNLMIDWYNE